MAMRGPGSSAVARQGPRILLPSSPSSSDVITFFLDRAGATCWMTCPCAPRRYSRTC